MTELCINRVEIWHSLVHFCMWNSLTGNTVLLFLRGGAKSAEFKMQIWSPRCTENVLNNKKVQNPRSKVHVGGFFTPPHMHVPIYRLPLRRTRGRKPPKRSAVWKIQFAEYHCIDPAYIMYRKYNNTIQCVVIQVLDCHKSAVSRDSSHERAPLTINNRSTKSRRLNSHVAPLEFILFVIYDTIVSLRYFALVLFALDTWAL